MSAQGFMAIIIIKKTHGQYWHSLPLSFSSSRSLFSDIFLPPGVSEAVGGHFSLHGRTTGIPSSFLFSSVHSVVVLQ